jgi:4'-phosphopantetheinyl transferase
VSCSLLTIDPALLCRLTSALEIEPQTVHVWAFSLDASVECRKQCYESLCGTEQNRAHRFVHERSRNDFVVAHGVLRQLLGRYSGLPPRIIALSSAPNGKPRLDSRSPNGAAISFNLTHSHGRALVAVSDGREVGIDLEKIEPEVRALAIARRYFCRAELAAIESAAVPLQPQTFYRYWVAKEAVLKAQGIGLAFPIDRFEVQFRAQGSTARIRTCEPSRLGSDWTIRMLPLEGDWLGALAVRGEAWTLRLENAMDAHESVPLSAVPKLSGEESDSADNYSDDRGDPT